MFSVELPLTVQEHANIPMFYLSFPSIFHYKATQWWNSLHCHPLLLIVLIHHLISTGIPLDSTYLTALIFVMIYLYNYYFVVLFCCIVYLLL